METWSYLLPILPLPIARKKVQTPDIHNDWFTEERKQIIRYMTTNLRAYLQQLCVNPYFPVIQLVTNNDFSAQQGQLISKIPANRNPSESWVHSKNINAIISFSLLAFKEGSSTQLGTDDNGPRICHQKKWWNFTKSVMPIDTTYKSTDKADVSSSCHVCIMSGYFGARLTWPTST